MLNSISLKLSYVKWNLKKKKKIVELEFHIYIYIYIFFKVWSPILDFLQIEFYIETWFWENRVSKQRHRPKYFQHRDISLNFFKNKSKNPFSPRFLNLNTSTIAVIFYIFFYVERFLSMAIANEFLMY